jgi:hypothetical protein
MIGNNDCSLGVESGDNANATAVEGTCENSSRLCYLYDVCRAIEIINLPMQANQPAVSPPVFPPYC